MKLLILIAVLGVVYGEYHSEDRCEEGPTLWCANLHYAKRCGAVKHCMDTVWTKQKIQGSNTGASCTVCQLMVNNARQLFKAQASDDEVSNLISKACHLMPSSVVGKGCKDAMKTYLPDILSLIRNEKLDSRMLCQLIGICQGMEELEDTPAIFKDTAVNIKDTRVLIPAIPEVQPEVKSNDKICDDCTNFFNDIRQMLTSNTTEKEMEDFINANLCTSLRGLESICKNLVAKYVPVFFQYLSDEVSTPQICAAIQFCKTGEKFVSLPRLLKSKLNIDECAICKESVGEARDLLRNPSVQASIKDLLENHVCPLLGSSAAICKQYIEAYAPALFQLLVSELDPVKLCTEIGFCTASQVEVKTVLASSPMYRIVKPDMSKPPAGKVAGSPACVLCEFVLQEVDKILKQNTSVVAVTSALEQVCELFPSTIKTECVAFVKQYAKLIITLLVQEVDPKKICITIGICAKTQNIPMIPNVLIQGVPLSPLSDSLECEACKQVVDYLDKFIMENSTAQDVEMVLEKVCGVLPQTYRKPCDTIVDSYAPYILQLLAQLANSKEICEKFQICPTPAKMNHNLFFKSHLLGNKKCTYGPSYWCASRENAKNCKAEEHCRKHVWKNQS